MIRDIYFRDGNCNWSLGLGRGAQESPENRKRGVLTKVSGRILGRALDVSLVYLYT